MPHQCTGCGHVFADGSKEMLSGCPECGGNKFQFRPEGASFPDDPDAEPESQADGRRAAPSSKSEPPQSPAAEPPDPDGSSSSVAETVGRATTRVRDFVSSSPGNADPADPDSEPNPDASWPSEREEPDDSPGETDGTAAGGGGADADPSSSGGTDPHDGIIDADARRDDADGIEDDAQASARTDVVSADELDGAGSAETGSADAGSADAGDPDATGADAGNVDADGVAASTEAPTAGPEPDPLVSGGSASPPASDGDVVGEPAVEEPDLAELREQLNDQFESIKIVEPGQYELNLMELYDREEYIIALQENGRYVIQVPEQWLGDAPGER